MINTCLVILGILRVILVSVQPSSERNLKQPIIHVASIEETHIRNIIGTENCSCPERIETRTKNDVVWLSSSREVEGNQASKIGDDFDPNSEFQVPNIVHYIWFNTEPRPLQFHHMLSILSAHKILNPEVVYFHTNMEPTGTYWERVRSLPKLKVMYRDPPITLFGEKVKEPYYYTSHSNVDRVKILQEYGGIYLDFDVLVTRPFDDLRKHVCTIGLERETQACGSVIVCSKKAVFLLLWLNAYLDDYRITEWAYNTGKVPFNLARRYPHLVNVEKTSLNRPNFKELDKIWGPNSFDWQMNYAVHIWYRLWKDMSPYYKGVEPNSENIKTWNATFGEMARSILYGTRDFISSDALMH